MKKLLSLLSVFIFSAALAHAGVLSGGVLSSGGQSGGSAPPSGAAGGDLSGTYPNPAVAKLAGTTPSAFFLTTVDDADAATFRATIGAGTGNGTITSVATTSPITGGTVVSGAVTVACGTCGVTGSPLSQFAATTSAQFLGIISDETGSGLVMGNSGPTIIGPMFTGQASPTYALGKLTYDTDNQSLTFYNNDSNVSLQVGQEEWIRVINNTGVSIANGAAVYVNGSSTGLPTIALAQANAGTTTVVAGLATETIANGATGFITSMGIVHGLDTSGFIVGNIFLSSSVAGGLTQTAPTAPNFRYRVGFVTSVNASTGTIHVTPTTAALGNGTANQLFGINTGGTAQEVKSLVVGTAGTDFAIANTTNTMTFNLPDAGASARGAVTTGAQTFAGAKTFSSTIVGSINGNAATVTTNANLTGAITSSGNATSLGSFSSANLLGALTDETGTGSAVFAGSPAFTGTVTGAAVTWSGLDTALGFAPTGSASTGDRLYLPAASNPAIAANGQPVMVWTGNASAVDYVNVINGTTANPGTVQIQASGTDTNIQIVLNGKGTGAVNINPQAAGAIGLVVKGAASQSASLQEWQKSDNTVYASISSVGNFSAPSYTSNGTKFTITGCSAGTTVGGATAGRFSSGTTGACTVVITMAGATGITAPNGWACAVNDDTTANLYRQTATSTTTATVSGTTVSGDIVSFACTAY